ncbi:endonuclease/exonuclease/phosphatase family protein [Streptomyces sp. NPDC050428]|uniref:endonuclease/exonuclease/phosphatase family protein n=1 Tax=Streptomyces sp. NPDC050428 TaxID=3155757 RepID=UPI0034177BEA
MTNNTLATTALTDQRPGGVADLQNGPLIRAVNWNLLCGGVDGDSEKRLHAQGDILAELRPDLLVMPECSWWDEQYNRRLWWMANRLGLIPAAMMPSRVGDGHNFTTMMYRPSKLTLIGTPDRKATEIFRHVLIRARFRPTGTTDDRHDFLALGTHFSHANGKARLKEACEVTDYGGPFPGTPGRSLLIGDLNCPRMDADPDWDKVPQNMHARYRIINPDGTFGGVDVAAMGVLLESGWTDPADTLGITREATVGYYYPNEPVPLHLDHILTTAGITPRAYETHDTPTARRNSDHLPTWLDFQLSA